MSLKKTDFPKICRMCLSFKKEMLSLQVPEVVQMIRICIDIEIRSNDGLPQTICVECSDQIHKYSVFRQKCKNSNEILHKIINDNDNCTYSYDLYKNVHENTTFSTRNVKNELLNSVKDEPSDNESYSDNLMDITETHDISKMDELNVKNELTNKKIKTEISTNSSDNKKSTRCTLCNKTISKSKLKSHMRRHNLENKYKCDHCSKAFKVPSELAKHLDVTHGQKAGFECQVCSKKFYLQIQLDLHIKTHFKLKKQCNICGREFSLNKNLLRHKKIHEKRERIYCLQCDQTFLHARSLEKHVQRFHNPDNVQNVTVNEKKACPICGKLVSDVKIHTRNIHSEVKPFKCDQCDQAFIFSSALKTHIKYIHKREKKALCPICGKAYTNQGELNRHFASTHDENFKYNCHLCTKSYKTKAGYQHHLIVHKGIRSFACSFCPKKFFSKRHMQRHILTHSGERPFACHICGQTFTQKAARQIHMKVHNICTESNKDINSMI